MTTHIHETAELGDLVVAAFDEAALYSHNPGEVSRLATRAVAHILSLQSRRIGPSVSRSPAPVTMLRAVR